MAGCDPVDAKCAKMLPGQGVVLTARLISKMPRLTVSLFVGM
jgi:hypothetical protein